MLDSRAHMQSASAKVSRWLRSDMTLCRNTRPNILGWIMRMTRVQVQHAARRNFQPQHKKLELILTLARLWGKKKKKLCPEASDLLLLEKARQAKYRLSSLAVEDGHLMA